MKKQSRKVLALMLIVSLILSALSGFSSGASTQYPIQSASSTGSYKRIETKDGIRYYGTTGNAQMSDSQHIAESTVITCPDDYNKLMAVNQNNKTDLAKTSALPSYVDNSNTRFFPAIGDQGQLGSCQYWAQVYYQFTYTMNKEMGVTTTPQNTFSPQWAYNIVASTDDMVSTYYDVYTMMSAQGNVFQSQVPYTQDTKSFFPTEDIWKTSIRYRVKDYQKFNEIGSEDSCIASPDDTDLLAIKTSLASGDILAFSTYVYSWDITKLKQNSSATENKNYTNQEVLREVDGSEGSHRMTIVGYNDNIWTDINNNNQVDSGEMGALKIANSWGDSWGNKGFMWVSYDALNEVSCVQDTPQNEKRKAAISEVCRIDVLKHAEDSQLYLKYTVNTSDRTQTKITINAEKDGTPYKRQVFSNMFHGAKIAYDGSDKATDATMIALLSNVVDDIKSEDLSSYSLSVTFEDMKSDSAVLTVKDAQIIDETAGKVYTAQNSYPFTLDGESKTVKYTESDLNHAVVYYRGYDNPTIIYKTGNSDYIKADLEPNTERRGYVHKYVIDLGENDSATLYFSDKNGNTDNNSGRFFTAKRGLNFYVTENTATKITGKITNDCGNVADVDMGCDFTVSASGGYAPYQYRYTFTNLDTNEQNSTQFSEKPETIYYFRQVGKYRVSVEVMDFSDEIEVIETVIDIQNLPFSFKEMYTQKRSNLVGDTVALTAISQNEKIKYTGFVKNKYDFVIKDEQGNICHKSTVSCKKCNLNKRYTETIESFVPHKSGTYTATVSSTDGNNEFAQLSITFDVFDKTIGDCDSDGAVSVVDATKLQRMLTGLVCADEVNLELADCDKNQSVDILDATYIQRYVALLSGCALTGEIIEYIPPVTPTDPPVKPTDPPVKPTDPPVTKNEVTFTNSFHWGGNICCYYWSDSDTNMTSWPGTQMTSIGVNEYGETMYTYTLPQDVTYIIFTNGSDQTTDITYNGGEVRYYPVSSTDSKGHNLVKTW